VTPVVEEAGDHENVIDEALVETALQLSVRIGAEQVTAITEKHSTVVNSALAGNVTASTSESFNLPFPYNIPKLIRRESIASTSLAQFETLSFGECKCISGSFELTFLPESNSLV
jgi:hypothetical protein